MLLLCTSGLGFITTNICKQKIFTAYKKGISHRPGNALFSFVTGFPPITLFHTFRFFQNQSIVVDNPIIRIIQLQCHCFIGTAHKCMDAVFPFLIRINLLRISIQTAFHFPDIPYIPAKVLRRKTAFSNSPKTLPHTNPPYRSFPMRYSR